MNVNHSLLVWLVGWLVAGPMDDVLDSVCLLHLHRNVHGHLSVLVPVLLRGEGDHGHLAAVAGHQGQFHAVPEVCAPHADAQGECEYF